MSKFTSTKEKLSSMQLKKNWVLTKKKYYSLPRVKSQWILIPVLMLYLCGVGFLVVDVIKNKQLKKSLEATILDILGQFFHLQNEK